MISELTRIAITIMNAFLVVLALFICLYLFKKLTASTPDEKRVFKHMLSRLHKKDRWRRAWDIFWGRDTKE